MKNNNTTLSTRSVHSRYIVAYEDVFDALDIYERSVYEALRYDADFSDPTKPVEKTIAELCEKSKVKERKVYYALDNLENKFFLIKRLNWENGTYGKTNCYEVAHHLNYFKPVENSEIEKKEIKPKKMCTKKDVHTNEKINEYNSKKGLHMVQGVLHMVQGCAHDPVIEKVKKAECETLFEIFWTIYPINKNKHRAAQLWEKYNLDEIALPLIEKLIQQIKEDDDWKRGFAPHGATYLSQKRWNDEITKSKSNLHQKPSASPKGKNLNPLPIYLEFVSQLKIEKQFGSIPSTTKVPTFEEWKENGMQSDFRAFKRELMG